MAISGISVLYNRDKRATASIRSQGARIKSRERISLLLAAVSAGLLAPTHAPWLRTIQAFLSEALHALTLVLEPVVVHFLILLP